jgi:hypothetical protein
MPEDELCHQVLNHLEEKFIFVSLWVMNED